MRKYAIIISAIISLLNVPSLILAQNSAVNDSLRWNLQTCLEYAWKNNIQVRSLQQTQLSNEQDLLLAKAAKLPNLSASVTQTLVHSNNTNPVVGGFQTQANLSGNYGLSSNFIVYNGGYLNNDVKQKDLSVKASGLDIQTAMNSITLQITQAFLNILLVKENIVHLKDLLTTSQAQLRQGQQRYDAGSISRKDFIQLQSQVAMDQFNLTYAQNNRDSFLYRQNLVTLKQVLQLSSEVDFDISAPDTLAISAEIPSLKDAEQAALQTRPEIKSAELGVRIAEVDLQKSKAGRLPVVSLGASIASGYSDNQTTKFGSQIDNNFYQRLGLAVNIPIFNNRIAKTNIELSKIQIEQARLSLQNTKTTLDQAVEQAYISWSNAQSQFAAADVQFKTNEESYHITTEQLRLGAVNMVDLLQQKTLYIQSLQLYIQAKYSAILNQKIFDFYSGVPITL